MNQQMLSIAGIQAQQCGFYQVYLPGALNLAVEDVDAVYEKGFLQIRVRKAQPHRIPIRTDEPDISQED